MTDTATDRRNACCRDAANLTVVEARTDLAVKQCLVCGRRHFAVKLDPGTMAFKADPLGHTPKPREN